MSSDGWDIAFDKMIEVYASKTEIPAERLVTDWIAGKPWIYIDHLMRVVVPDSDVFSIVYRVLEVLKAEEFSLTCNAKVDDTKILCQEIKEISLDEENRIIISNLTHEKLLTILKSILDKKLDKKLIHVVIKGYNPERLIVAQHGGQIFIEGALLSTKEKIEIVQLILSIYGKEREFGNIKNKLKGNFQIVIMHRRAPVTIYAVK
ncbi:MAG: hypothetical protein ACP6IU_03020 [Candidatus Asgardarchaeia archaeon]